MVMDKESSPYTMSVIKINDVPANAIRRRLMRKNFSMFTDGLWVMSYGYGISYRVDHA